MKDDRRNFVEGIAKELVSSATNKPMSEFGTYLRTEMNIYEKLPQKIIEAIIKCYFELDLEEKNPRK